MDRESFDSKEGIVNRIHTLEDIVALLKERYVYGQEGDEQKEKLHVFFILGKLWLSKDGLACSIEYNGKDRSVVSSDVLTADAFVRLFGGYWRTGKFHHSWMFERPCSYCAKPWTLDDIGQVERSFRYEFFDLSPYIGQTLGDVETTFEHMSDGHRVFAEEITVYSACSAHKDQPLECKNCKQKLNRFQGHEKPYSKSTKYRSAIIEPRDFIKVIRYQYYHKSCHKEKFAEPYWLCQFHS